MFSYLRKRAKSDSGNTIVGALIILPLMTVMTMSGIDQHVYSSNSILIDSMAKSGAETVGNLGSNDPDFVPAAYKGSSKMNCDDAKASVFGDAQANTPIECGIVASLSNADGHGLVNVGINKVTCGPNYAQGVGDTTYCTVEWNSKPLPWSFRSIFGMGEDNLSCQTASSQVKITKKNLGGNKYEPVTYAPNNICGG